MDIAWIDLFRALGTGGIFMALGGAIVAWLRTRAPVLLAQTERERSAADSNFTFRSQDLSRIAVLENKVDDQNIRIEREREECDKRIERLQERHSAELGELKVEFQMLRHDRNNMEACFLAMVTMLKREGANVPEVVALVEEMMERGKKALALEKGAMAGGRLAIVTTTTTTKESGLS